MKPIDRPRWSLSIGLDGTCRCAEGSPKRKHARSSTVCSSRPPARTTAGMVGSTCRFGPETRAPRQLAHVSMAPHSGSSLAASWTGTATSRLRRRCRPPATAGATLRCGTHSQARGDWRKIDFSSSQILGASPPFVASSVFHFYFLLPGMQTPSDLHCARRAGQRLLLPLLINRLASPPTLPLMGVSALRANAAVRLRCAPVRTSLHYEVIPLLHVLPRSGGDSGWTDDADRNAGHRQPRGHAAGQSWRAIPPYPPGSMPPAPPTFSIPPSVLPTCSTKAASSNRCPSPPAPPR